ncbi:MAG: hypothetical protein ABFD98_17055 [Syntrophobacteraceae bacterium]|nr:hypothetical protein [Desulfobacteraceae bacterium]
MKPESSRALLGLCCLLLLAGLPAMSPSASFLATAAAAFPALAAAFLGKKSVRLAGAVLLLLSLAAAAWFLPSFQKEHAAFRQHGKPLPAPVDGTLPEIRKKNGE